MWGRIARMLLVPASVWMSAPVRSEVMISSLSTHRVLISSNYTGAQISIFGSVERDGHTAARADPYDIVITVTGPRRQLVVREKDRSGPFWLNRNQQRFDGAPAFMVTLTTRQMAEMGSEEDARRLVIGLKNKLLSTDAGLSDAPEEARFTDALIRLKSQDRLYSEVERGVTFLTPSLFQARLDLPAKAPTGNYDVRIDLLVGQVRLASHQTSFEVVQIGFEQQVAEFAKNWAFLYGLTTALTAILFGWFATVVFRRD